MDEKALKTTWKQRLVVLVVAVLLLGSTVLTYAFVVLSGSSNSNDVSARADELMAQYDAKKAELEEASKPLSEKYFGTFNPYLAQVKAYNEASAIDAVLDTKDLKTGTGRELEEGDKDYLAYYIGWCADGTIFDTSLDDTEDPTSLKAPLDAAQGLVEGWEQGVIGMKLGGVRQITMNGDLAYGETQEICGGYNKPLRFIVMPVEYDEAIVKLNSELSEIYTQLYLLYAGVGA